MICPLCHLDESSPRPPARDGRLYWACRVCDLYYLDAGHRLTAAAERARYDLHTHDSDDVGYAEFARPLVDAIVAARPPAGVPGGARGLDFGAGRVPLLARRLERLGYAMSIYDAFYWPDAAALDVVYDFALACEVIEHLYEPAAELKRLRALLKPGAPLFVMTDVRRDDVDFDQWAYRRDPTHVAFFSARTFHWLGRAFGFRNVRVTPRVITLFNPGG